MKQSQKKTRQYITLMFVVLMTYLVGSLCSDFKYIDLAYLIVIALGFIRFMFVKGVN